MMNFAVGYVRVSTPSQAIDGVSIDAQCAKIEAWAKLNGFKLVAIYTDAGIRGARMGNRPALQQALEAVCRCRGALVVHSLSRLARSTKDAIEIAERLDRAGADLVSLSEQLDTTSPMGRFLFRLMAALSELERDQIGERTQLAMAYKRSQGKRISRFLPFGFDLATDGETLLENPTEQAALYLMQELRESGLSLREICAELEKRSVLNKSGDIHWSPAVVRAILLREAAA